MSKLLTGSICFTDLLEALKAGHSSGSRAKNNKVYVNVNVWINDEKDKFGNDASIQINPKMDSGHEKKYIGNLKFFEKKGPEPVSETDFSKDSDGDLPF